MALPTREDFARLEQTIGEVVTRLDTLIGLQQPTPTPVTVHVHGEITPEEARAVAAQLRAAGLDPAAL